MKPLHSRHPFMVSISLLEIDQFTFFLVTITGSWKIGGGSLFIPFIPSWLTFYILGNPTNKTNP